VKIVRFSISDKTQYGTLENDRINGFKGSPFLDPTGYIAFFEPDGSQYHPNEIELLAPCLPSKIVCLGLNYHSHAQEVKLEIPAVPLIFLKPSTAVTGPGAAIILPPSSKRVDYEGELGIVIGKKAKDITEDKASEYILGYTCFNDVTERHNQKEDGQWTRGKSYDTFAPTGPSIETDIEPDDLKLETFLNGELRQSIRTSDLIFGVPKLISFISNVMTLLPGDIIATGTPSGIGRMNPGDIVEVKIEKIGTLKNFVVAPD
jgi:2-keto-4-pentenoate hydratase/2-oxohepta-3-ene-1,7-dioic acid hydratase in catechol pathway